MTTHKHIHPKKSRAKIPLDTLSIQFQSKQPQVGHQREVVGCSMTANEEFLNPRSWGFLPRSITNGSPRQSVIFDALVRDIGNELSGTRKY